MNTIRNWWIGYCQTVYRNSRIKRQQYLEFYLIVLVLSAFVICSIVLDTHPVIHHKVVALTHHQWLERVRTVSIGMAVLNLGFIFQLASLYRYGTDDKPPVVLHTTEEIKKAEATIRRLFLLYAAMFTFGAVAMIAKHKPLLAEVFLIFALIDSVGVAFYFRLRGKR